MDTSGGKISSGADDLAQVVLTGPDATADALGRHAASQAAGKAKRAATEFGLRVQRSQLLLNGVLLVLAGFLGVWSALSLQVQDAIISVYVLIFGVLLIAFKLGSNKDVLDKYFGFMNSGEGQLLFLVVAGNLAWFTGWVGVLVAIFTNINGALAWYYARVETSGDNFSSTEQ